MYLRLLFVALSSFLPCITGQYSSGPNPTVPSQVPTIPSSNATVSVKIFNAFHARGAPQSFFAPAPGSLSNETSDAYISGWSFLIEHPTRKTKIVFDLGWGPNETVPHDHGAAAPAGVELLEHSDIPDQLVEEGTSLDEIDDVIWSHSHIDHIGKLDGLPHWTRLNVGPGTVNNLISLNGSEPFQGQVSELWDHRVKEIPFRADGLKIGDLEAYDFFGDGSFYLLNAPGHCVGHMVGLARVTSGATPSFVLLAGDVVHHPALIRPSTLVLLPDNLRDEIPPALRNVGAPAYNQAFLAFPPANISIHHDPALAQKTFEALQVFDAHPDVFFMIAHDTSIEPVIGALPAVLDGWRVKGWKEKAAWAYLQEGNPCFRWPSVEPLMT